MRRKAITMNTNDLDKKRWAIFKGGLLLLHGIGQERALPQGETPPLAPPSDSTIHEVEHVNGSKVSAFYVMDEAVEAPQGYEWVALRESFDFLPLAHYELAGKASQILLWDRNTRYCPHCGVRTIQIAPIAKKCNVCGQEWYPHLAPAVIVLVRKDNKILLVRSKQFKRNYMGLVAGFLEPGESLEACVHREVKEETGLRIHRLQYFDSQAWPYPSGVMIGFTAEYLDGDLTLQEEELSAGGFYDLEHLPPIPHPLSIARRLIDAWIAEQRT